MTEPTELTDAEIREMVSGAEYGNEDHRQTIALGNALLAAREQLAQAEARDAELAELCGRYGLPTSATALHQQITVNAAFAHEAMKQSVAILRERAEAAEAGYAALACILASPNPGALVLAKLEQARTRIAELEAFTSRASELMETVKAVVTPDRQEVLLREPLWMLISDMAEAHMVALEAKP